MAGKLKTIISASRRTDLPRFHYAWLQHVLRRGSVELTNPRYKEKKYTVNLKPENIHTIVLWSKDFGNVLKDAMYLENYNLYFQYTVNNYSALLEPHVPQYNDTIKTLAGLLKVYKPEQFNIRFDPIIISTKGEIIPDHDKPGRARLKVFEQLCSDLVSLDMKNCRLTTSYITLYRPVKIRLKKSGLGMLQLDHWLQAQFFSRMADIAGKYSLTLYSCASPLLEDVRSVIRGRCIDGHLLEALFGGKVSKTNDTGQRAACGCTKSIDIGSYDQMCGFKCTYCYGAAF